MRLNHPNDELGSHLLLMLPQAIVHEIDLSSPLMPPLVFATATKLYSNTLGEDQEDSSETIPLFPEVSNRSPRKTGSYSDTRSFFAKTPSPAASRSTSQSISQSSAEYVKPTLNQSLPPFIHNSSKNTNISTDKNSMIDLI